MKKKIGLLIIAIFLLLTLIGCNESAYDKYQNSLKRTNEVERGREKFKIEINNEFNNYKLSREDELLLDPFENIISETEVSYNKDNFLADIYFKYGLKGMDFKFFKNGENQYFEVPIIGKYVLIDNDSEILNDMKINDVSMSEIQNEKVMEFIEEVKIKYSELIKTKDVLKLEKLDLNTPEGLVKVQKFSVNLDKVTLKVLKEEMLLLLKKYEFDLFAKSEKGVDDFFNSFDIEKFYIEAYVDHDNMIVKDILDIEIISGKTDLDNFIKTKVVVETNRWDLNKKFSIEFPLVEDEDMVDINSLKDLNDKFRR